jgi:histidinol dehydrogenase
MSCQPAAQHASQVPLGVDAFIKKSSFLHYTEEALDAYGQYIIDMAEQEQLEAHANAARVRMNHGKKD